MQLKISDRNPPSCAQRVQSAVYGSNKKNSADMLTRVFTEMNSRLSLILQISLEDEKKKNSRDQTSILNLLGCAILLQHYLLHLKINISQILLRKNIKSHFITHFSLIPID